MENLEDIREAIQAFHRWKDKQAIPTAPDLNKYHPGLSDDWKKFRRNLDQIEKGHKPWTGTLENQTELSCRLGCPATPSPSNKSRSRLPSAIAAGGQRTGGWSEADCRRILYTLIGAAGTLSGGSVLFLLNRLGLTWNGLNALLTTTQISLTGCDSVTGVLARSVAATWTGTPSCADVITLIEAICRRFLLLAGGLSAAASFVSQICAKLLRSGGGHPTRRRRRRQRRIRKRRSTKKGRGRQKNRRGGRTRKTGRLPPRGNSPKKRRGKRGRVK